MAFRSVIMICSSSQRRVCSAGITVARTCVSLSRSGLVLARYSHTDQAAREGCDRMVDHAKFFNAAAKLREHPYLIKLRTNLPQEDTQPVISLGGGLPCPTTFPFKEASFTLHTGEVLHLPQNLMEAGLQYGPAAGIPAFIAQLRELSTRIFDPPHMDERGLIITSGANHGIYLIIHTFLDDGDCFFMQESTYSTMLDALRSTKVNVVPVLNDHEGLRPDLLREALRKTPAARRKLLYLVPSGDNPTSITMSARRRREIYEVACEFDLLIVEDDAYYFMQYGDEAPPPSFLSLDTERRVLRIDTFAKTMGPGFRLGYIIADKVITDKLESFTASIMAHAPMLSQVILMELFRMWGVEGFLKFTNKTREVYKKKREGILQAASKHLTGLCEWTAGDGMFLWLKVLGVDDVRHIVEHECQKRDVMLVPGHACMWHQAKPSPYIRASFSVVTPHQAEEAFKVLADAIRAELEKKKGQSNGVTSDHSEGINGQACEGKKEANGIASET